MAIGAAVKWVLLCCVLSNLCGCSPRALVLEPKVSYAPQQSHIEELPSAFAPLSREECVASWGKELLIGDALAKELDLYRAITAYKRSRILIPSSHEERVRQLEYDLYLSYYLAQHYQEALEFFEKSDQLQELTNEFPAIRELLLTVADSYFRTQQPEKAVRVIELLRSLDPILAQGIEIQEALVEGKLALAQYKAHSHPAACEVSELATSFASRQLSVRKAQLFNGLLPGAGYYYVGQCKAAVTSFVINALFATATYQLYKGGYWAPALICGSLEMGWYIGGINGAGLAAKQYNEAVYELRAKEIMVRGRLFPVLMLETAF